MNIYTILEEELNLKLGYLKINFNASLFNNNIIFFINKSNDMYFNKNMLLDLFSDSSIKLLIYNYIIQEDNIWPLDFLKKYNYSFEKIKIKELKIIKLYENNKIYKYFYFIDIINNNWQIYSTNNYKDHVIYIKSINDIYSYLNKVMSKAKKNILFKLYKHNDLSDYALNNKLLFQKYLNIIYTNDNVYAEIEINNFISSQESLRQILSTYNIGI